MTISDKGSVITRKKRDLGILSLILKCPVATSERFSRIGDPASLEPQEAEAVAGAVQSRQAEYAAGRSCARLALGRLGFSGGLALLRRSSGAVAWPEGYVGSITHCAGYVGAAVARTQSLPAIGIDAEPSEQLPEDLLDIIASPSEAALLPNDSGTLALIAPKILFSSKEACYKAWADSLGRVLDFGDIAIKFDFDHGSFIGSLSPPIARYDRKGIGELAGRFVVKNGLIVTAAVPRSGARLLHGG